MSNFCAHVYWFVLHLLLPHKLFLIFVMPTNKEVRPLHKWIIQWFWPWAPTNHASKAAAAAGRFTKAHYFITLKEGGRFTGKVCIAGTLKLYGGSIKKQRKWATLGQACKTLFRKILRSWILTQKFDFCYFGTFLPDFSWFWKSDFPEILHITCPSMWAGALQLAASLLYSLYSQVPCKVKAAERTVEVE